MWRAVLPRVYEYSQCTCTCRVAACTRGRSWLPASRVQGILWAGCGNGPELKKFYSKRASLVASKPAGHQRSSVPGSSSLSGKMGNKVWLLILPFASFCLGTWQIFRLRWKVGLVENLEKRTTQPPIAIPADLSERLDELEYRRVVLRGHFDHSRELYIHPRGLYTGSQDKPSPKPGAQVITPFYCLETGYELLINRGWVPRKKMSPETRQQGQTEGDITLTAFVRTQEVKPLFAPKSKPEKNHWTFRDVAKMAQLVGTHPVMLDADATTTVPGGPIGGQTRVFLRNEHVQYIFTWYALGLATTYMFYLLVKKKWR